MRRVRTLHEYLDLNAQVRWGPLGPLDAPAVFLIPASVGRAPAGRRPRTPARRVSSVAAYEARCPKCGARAAVGRDAVLCFRTLGGCGVTMPLTPGQQAARLRQELAARGA